MVIGNRLGFGPGDSSSSLDGGAMPYADKEAQKEYQRKWLAKRRAEYLKNKVCVWCGTGSNLELDHINRDTKINHRVWSWSAERREAELAKCQVLCKNCHDDKSYAMHDYHNGKALEALR